MNTRLTRRRRSRSARIRVLGWLAVTSSLALALLAPASTAFATQPDPLHKVTICHRTDATTNPYVQITVDEASVDGDAGNDNGKGDHLIKHTGPAWTSDQPNGGDWGDIIPPFYSDGATPTGYASLNWDAAGQAIFYNECNPTTDETTTESTTDETTGGGGQVAGETTTESTTDETTTESTTSETTGGGGRDGPARETTTESTTDETTTEATTDETTTESTDHGRDHARGAARLRARPGPRGSPFRRPRRSTAGRPRIRTPGASCSSGSPRSWPGCSS